MKTFDIPKKLKAYYPNLIGREAEMPLTFFIEEKHVKEANRRGGQKSPINCVLSCAGEDSKTPPELFLGAITVFATVALGYDHQEMAAPPQAQKPILFVVRGNVVIAIDRLA